MSRAEDGPSARPNIDDAMDEPEDIVDTDAEREQVRETMRTLRRTRRPRPFGRIRSCFDVRDAGAALGDVLPEG